MKSVNLFLIITSVLLCSCSLFKAPEFERVNEVQLKDLTVSHTNLYLSIVIANPNWYSITVKSLYLDVMDKSRNKLGSIVMTKPLEIDKHGVDTVYFEIQLDTRKVARILSYSSNKVEFIVKAEAQAKVLGISKRIRLEQPQEVNFTKIIESLLPSIPSDIEIPTIKTTLNNDSQDNKLVVRDPNIKQNSSYPIKPDIFKVVKTSITDIGIKETELTIKFVLMNPYGLAFTFKDFPSEVWINNLHAGNGKLAQPIFFDENVFSADGELVFSLNNVVSVLLASKALMKKDMVYQVNGTLMVEGFGTNISKPFQFRGSVEIGKKDKLPEKKQ